MRHLNPAAFLAIVALNGAGRPLTSLKESNDVEIVGLDYAFQVPSTVSAGKTTFRFVNRGKVAHELNISLLKTGASVERFLEVVRTGKPTGEFLEAPVGVLFAAAGKRGDAGLSTDLLPGRTYVVICINRDKPNAKRHVDMGMYSVVVPTVVSTQTRAPKQATAVDTIVAAEYSYRYPRQLSPGHHSIAFTNAGKVRHEIAVVLLNKGVSIEQALKVEKDGGDVDALIDEDFGVLHAPAETSPFGRLEIEMLPGREYAFICSFANDAKSPPHAKLGMFGSIRVTGTPSR